ncbi:MAG: hypothetical protein RR777_04515 [Christensenellaceae bacterium]
MREELAIAKSYIESKTDFRPEIAVVLGSGAGGYAEKMTDKVIEFDYAEIPGFPVSTAPGHAGKLTFGCIEGKKVALLREDFTAMRDIVQSKQ